MANRYNFTFGSFDAIEIERMAKIIITVCM